jgi:hypothetical protein
MKKRRRLLLIVLVVFSIGGLAWLFLRTNDPLFHGKPESFSSPHG